MAELQIPEHNSLWQQDRGIADYPALQENVSTEVTVIGGGIAGIITAYLLTKAGKQVTLIEARKLLEGVTGHTTAKVTAQHGPIYHKLIKTFGEQTAKLYYEANMDALNFFRYTMDELGIECDFAGQDAYIYAESEKTKMKLEEEAEAYKTLGIDGGIAEVEASFPIDVKQAIVMRNQAQFHPVKFLAPLIKEIEDNGGKIYEKTRAIKVVNHKDPVIRTENMSHISSDKVVVATHYPFNAGDGMYFARMNISRSYVIGAKTTATVIPDGMYISADQPKRSIRYALDTDGEKILLLGGDGHRVGMSKEDTMQHYENLAEFGDKYFGIDEIPYRWSAQDMTTLDEVPYIGTMTSGYDNLLVATGFHKWGMTAGALAGLLLTDQILGRENRYAHVFNPTRSKMKGTDAKKFLKDNATVAKELVGGKLERPAKTAKDLEKGEGGVVSSNGKRAGAYKDEYGQVHLVDTTCTHMGCETHWNEAEKSWDCPCHGSRFKYTGEVLNGPAVKPLNKIMDQ
ncbi:FAD-dependent oxidoreductase [Indiicoccus explosivorum]|uniref:FAD-dependent oxidoreductase n=1 Tax=Indiicoccus explosivorum TaxID=1917864 RepID=UPI000B44E996|nr:FAD-dependent oxidoreductase [Indiicoccus explosivorum]